MVVAAVLTSISASSLPGVPLCPGTHGEGGLSDPVGHWGVILCGGSLEADVQLP